MSDTSNINSTVGILYRENHDWLLNWLIRKLSCPHHAADIVHDTFARVLTLSRTLDLQEPRAYLATTAKNLIIDQSRRQLIEQTYLAELTRTTEAMAPSPEQILTVVQILERVSTALEELDDKPQQAFLLHYLEGESQTAIASQLGVSDRMIRKYLVQALMHCYQACHSDRDM